jgi:hypothetical protein
MGQDRKYRGFRLYLPDGESRIQKDTITSTDVLHNSHGVGNFGPSMRARRQQYHGDRLFIRPDRSDRHYVVCAQMVGFVTFFLAIWMNAGNWKANVLFILAGLFILIKIGLLISPAIMGWLKRYWQ